MINSCSVQWLKCEFVFCSHVSFKVQSHYLCPLKNFFFLAVVWAVMTLILAWISIFLCLNLTLRFTVYHYKFLYAMFAKGMLSSNISILHSWTTNRKIFALLHREIRYVFFSVSNVIILTANMSVPLLVFESMGSVTQQEATTSADQQV